MNIWIINHYATHGFMNQGGRHFSIAKNLVKLGYSVTIFCSSYWDSEEKNLITNRKTKYLHKITEGINYIFIRTCDRRGNGLGRLINIIDFYRNTLMVSRKFNKPDVVIGSSVHPLACVAAIKLSNRYQCRNIIEIRDLWPESIVEYGIASPMNPLIKLLYRLEKWLYINANSIIFTVEGGKDYIIEKGWDDLHGGPVNLNKVYFINNGVDLESFDKNCIENRIDDSDLDDSSTFKLVYTGTIRRANNIDIVLDTAKLVKDPSIRFLLWGDGDQLCRLHQRTIDEKIHNVIFKGKVEKRYVPGIVSRANATFFILENTPLFRFGLSLNKSFEYLAAGKPIIIVGDAGYSMIDRNACGFHVHDGSIQSFVEAIKWIVALCPEEFEKICMNARKSAKDYDFKELANKVIEVIEGHNQCNLK